MRSVILGTDVISTGESVGSVTGLLLEGGGGPPPPFTPASLAGLTLWLDAADVTTITFSSGTNISAFADKSGNHYDFVNANPASQPTYVTGINGLKNLSISTAQGLANATAPLVRGSAPFTIFVVYEKTSVPTYSYLMQFIGDGSGNSPGLFLTASDPGSKFVNFGAKLTGTFGSVRCDDTFNLNTTPYALGLTYNGSGPGTTNYSFYSSNTLETTKVAQDLTLTSASNFLGGEAIGSDPLLGFLGEFIIYSRVLNSTELAQIETYFLAKWGV